MTTHFNSKGGKWERNYMPRTLMVFLNDEPNLSDSEKTEAAKQEAKESLSSYWGALEGTIDPNKVSKAADNSVIGNVTDTKKLVLNMDNKEEASIPINILVEDAPEYQREYVINEPSALVELDHNELIDNNILEDLLKMISHHSSPPEIQSS